VDSHQAALAPITGALRADDHGRGNDEPASPPPDDLAGSPPSTY
jgi:hypothetical protein